MVRLIRLKKAETFTPSDYESVLKQVPNLMLAGPEAVMPYVQKLLRHGFVYVLEESGRLLGFLGAYANDLISQCSFLSCLVVDESLRGQGWGSSLVEAWHATAKACGMELFSLHVLRSNNRAIAFYRRFGGLIVGVCSVDDQRWLMKGCIR